MKCCARIDRHLLRGTWWGIGLARYGGKGEDGVHGGELESLAVGERVASP